MGSRLCITFHTTYHAIKAESILKNAGVDCSLIPVPRKVSSVCGIALQCDNAESDIIELTLSHSGIEIESTSFLDAKDFSLLSLFRK